jgi:hypothetical protein
VRRAKPNARTTAIRLVQRPVALSQRSEKRTLSSNAPRGRYASGLHMHNDRGISPAPQPGGIGRRR